MEKELEQQKPIFESYIEKFKSIVDNCPDEDERDRLCFCGTCDGYGNVIVGNSARRCRNLGKYTYVSSITNELKRKNFEDWNHPIKTFYQLHQEKYTVTPSVTACENLLDIIREGNKYKGLFLCGNTGRSKTFSSIVLLKECAKLFKKTTICKYSYLHNMKAKGVEGSAYLDKFFAVAKKSEIVFIDDIYIEQNNRDIEHLRKLFKSVIDICYNQRYLLCTSDISTKSFSVIFGESIVSKLSSDYGEIIEETDQLDLRLE